MIEWRNDGKLAIVVYGMPRPQGSMTPFRNKNTGKLYVKSNETTKTWRSAVTAAAVEAANEADWTMLHEMVKLTTRFYFRRPKAMPKWRRAISPKWNGSDLDKLVRAIGDGLTDAGVYADDRQIQVIEASKWFALDDSPERAEVWVQGYTPERVT